MRPSSLARDPRHFQIAILATLLASGILLLDFDVPLARVPLVVGVALLTQFAFSRIRGVRFDFRSPLISSLSMLLILRSDHAFVLGAAVAAAVASKFVLRVRGKHVFNPTDLGIVLALVSTRDAWVSGGQWGSATVMAFLLACLGVLVTTRAARADVTFAFLGFHAALLTFRSLHVGEPMPIVLHRLSTGALVLFAFFMLSDPKTTPDSRAGRVAFAAMVALGNYFVTFVLFRQNGLLFSLAASALAVPLIDRLLPAARYAWPSAKVEPATSPSTPLPVRPASVGAAS